MKADWNTKLHYGIKNGERIKLEHLHSIIIYCDFSEISTDFS